MDEASARGRQKCCPAKTVQAECLERPSKNPQNPHDGGFPSRHFVFVVTLCRDSCA
ncbi:MAG: hypothetical protein OJF51_000269 [Nitrospira sp.]|nr:MAG: hypothetical protein OJF51_000269 [Nitrospira sp.]